jgi:hypothetical protein
MITIDSIVDNVISEYDMGKDCACIASTYSWVSVEDVKGILINAGYAEEDLRV